MYQTKDVLQQIREHAEKLGCSVRQLLAAADVAESQWSRWETGKTAPTTSTLQRIFAVKQVRIVTKAAVTK